MKSLSPQRHLKSVGEQEVPCSENAVSKQFWMQDGKLARISACRLTCASAARAPATKAEAITERVKLFILGNVYVGAD